MVPRSIPIISPASGPSELRARDALRAHVALESWREARESILSFSFFFCVAMSRLDKTYEGNKKQNLSDGRFCPKTFYDTQIHMYGDFYLVILD